MKCQTRLLITRSRWGARFVLVSMLALVLTAMGSLASAQGTATGPATAHDVELGLIINIGDPASPIPIDLDPTGQPWSKGFFDDKGYTSGGGTLDLFETIINVGTEAWGDWHEHIIGDPASASAPSFWSNVTSMEVNGAPITFTATGVGTKDLWLDNFSQPVLPGQTLTINKQIDVFNNSAGADGEALVRLHEYPTPFLIPEPSSCLLAVFGVAALMSQSSVIRRRKLNR